MSEVPSIHPERRLAIRRRARYLRRRRHASLFAATLVLVGGTVGAIAATRGSGAQSFQVITGGSCPASGVSVAVQLGEQVTLSELPKGYALVSGNPSSIADDPPRYQLAGTASQPNAPDILVTRQYPGSATSIPAKDDRFLGITTKTVSVDGLAASAQFTRLPGPPYTSEAILWSPAPGVTLRLVGSSIPAEELLGVANGLRYQPGTLQQLPATPVWSVSAARTRKALPSDLRPSARAVLTAWAEVDHLSSPGQPLPSGVDYRPVWLVYAPTAGGGGQIVWALVDAHTGTVLERPTTSGGGWVYAITDRSRPGCEPPLGVLTRTEIAEIEYGGPAVPAGYTLTLVTRQAASTASEAGGVTPCLADCGDPLVWLAYTSNPSASPFGGFQSGAPVRTSTQTARMTTFFSFDALTGNKEGSGGASAFQPGADLVPGPTPTTPSTTTIPTTTMPQSPPTTFAIVGASPFYPGTQNPRPAPAGNGKGAGGACTGTEIYPPCGPGVVPHEYYAYTLTQPCSGNVTFDGQVWRLELLPPSPQPPIDVWMILDASGSAGWVSSQGAVGMQPVPPGPAPTCPSQPTVPIVPPLQRSST